MSIILGIVEVVGSLGLFLFGMKVMSDGLQNSAGSRLQAMMANMTRNRFTALLTGLGVTSIIQSSSATTVFVVSFVSAGLLNLVQAIGVILGANIGTTLTAWIVSYLGFKFDIAHIAIPIIALGLPFVFMKSSTKKALGNVLIGFGILFLGLMYLKNAVPDIKQYPAILESIASLSKVGPISSLIFILIGTVLTVIVQSSSAAMAITLTMANAGWIDFQTAAALCLGENIGTTITAQIAAFSQNRVARQAAMAHTMFNVVGVVWALAALGLLTNFVEWIMPGNANSPADMPVHIALFHTLFNIINTFLFIWFVPAFARLIERMVPIRPEDESYQYKLRYVSTSMYETPEISLVTARNETLRMADKVVAMFAHYNQEREKSDSILPADLAGIFDLEVYVDQMHEEISAYIAQAQNDRPGDHTARQFARLLKIVSDLEMIADCINDLTKTLVRCAEKQHWFANESQVEVAPFIKEINQFLAFVRKHLATKLSPDELQVAWDQQARLDTFRNSLKKAARKRIQQSGKLKAELLYIDTLEQLERISDLIMDIAKELGDN